MSAMADKVQKKKPGELLFKTIFKVWLLGNVKKFYI